MEALCDYNNKSGGSMDRIGYANCVTSAWKNRAKNVKADVKQIQLYLPSNKKKSKILIYLMIKVWIKKSKKSILYKI